MEQFLRIGVITVPHGLKGEVKVYPTTDSPARFKEVENVIIKTPKGDVETQIEGVRFFKNLAIVKFAAFNDVDQVNDLHNSDIMIRREDAQPLEEGEYYIGDLLGCTVVTDEGIRLGSVEDVLQTGANDVYVVKAADGLEGAPKSGEILLPVIAECIVNTDIENSLITVHIMPGLL